MHKLLTYLFLTFTMSAYGQATLEGIVTDRLGKPVPYANVYLKGYQLGSETQQDGTFIITDVPYSDYDVVASAVGYGTVMKHIRVNGDVRGIEFLLQDKAPLEEVEVFGYRNQRAEKLETLTRLPLKPNEQLQSISILSSKLIDAQNALTLREVTKNVAGVYTFATYGNVRESMSLRGYRGIPLLKNGVRVNSDFRGIGIITDMAGVDNIQVLKGVSAISQGLGGDLGSAGGVINIVTKTPKFYNGGEVSFRTGSWGKVRPAFDTYGPLDKKKTVAFRVTGAYDRADSYRTQVNSERFYINPSLAWRPDDRTDIVLEMDYMDDSRTPDGGTINLGDYATNNIYKLPGDRFLGFDSDRNNSVNTTYAVRFERELTDHLALKAGYFISNLNTYAETSYTTAGGGRSKLPVLTSPYQRYRTYYASGRKDDNSVLQIDLIGKELETAAIKHTFQVGIDYRTTVFSNDNYTTAYAVDSIPYIDIIDVTRPIPNELPNGISVSPDPDRVTGAEIKSYGFTLQDKISFTAWADLFLGLRYTSMERTKGDYIGRTLAGAKRDNALNPLVGFNLKPLRNIIVFGSYASSSNPLTSFYRDIDGNKLGTERWDQFEGGIKSSWLDNALRFNITYFSTFSKNLNLRVLDTEGRFLGYYRKGGEDTRKGVEIEVTGSILPNLEVIGGYSYLDAKYKDHASYYYDSSPLNTPKHTANFWVRYEFQNAMEGLSIGAGTYYLGKRPHNVWSRNYTHAGVVPGVRPFDLKSYTTVNVQASYAFDDHFSIDVFGNNIFDELGYNAYRSVFLNRISPANYGATLRYQF